MTVERDKIVMVAPNWLGDAVMSLPALAVLAAADVPLAVMARPYTARIYAGIEGVDEVIVPAGAGRVARIVAGARAMRLANPRAAVILPPSFSSALAPWIAGVPVRTGYAADGRSGLLSDALPPPRRGSEHLSESYVRLARHALDRAGIAAGPPRETPRIRVFDADRREAADLRARTGGEAEYAVVIPGAAYGPAKSWPAGRFRELVAGLAREMPVLVAGGPSERELCETVSRDIAGAHNVAGATSLGGFLALAAGAAVVVANDSGTPHAAANLGTATVVLFGSTSPQWTRPTGGNVTVIRHPVHCSPCFRRTCPTQLECFAGIGVDEVLSAALASKKGVA